MLSVLTHQFVVEDLAIVAEPQVGQTMDSHGLHAIQVIHNGQSVEAKAAVVEVVHILNAESVWSAVGNLHASAALLAYTLVTTKDCPDATHGWFSMVFVWIHCKIK